ncbi:MAG TPA: PHP domain-containing protein [Candidatus Hydrogenedentes bacterium]|nr:PHP domain-containing protein [Candidatus Hydrogenedentota bacterium]
MKIDIHCHSEQHSPDSRIVPKELIQMAEAAGYDAVFLTDPGKVWSSRELAGLNEMCERLRILPGIEIALADGNTLLVLGADNPVYESLTTPSGVFAQACADGYLTVLAHPREPGLPLPPYSALADAVESITCHHPDAADSAAARAFAVERKLAELYASDARGLNYLNRYWIETLEPFDTVQDFRNLIIARRYGNRMRESNDVMPPVYKAGTLAELGESDMMALYIQPTVQSINP